MKVNGKSDVVDFDYVLNALPGAVVVYEIKSTGLKMQFCSDGIERVSGWKADEFKKIIEQDPFHGVYKEDEKLVEDAMYQAISNGKDVDVTYRAKHGDGSLIWLRMQGKVIEQADGRKMLQAVFLNVSKEYQLEEKLRESDASLRAAITHNKIAYWEIDYQENKTYFGERMRELFSIPRTANNEEGDNIRYQFVHPVDVPLCAKNMRKIREGINNISWECRILNPKTGDYFWCNIFYTALRDQQGKLVKAVGTAQNVHKAKELEQYFIRAQEQNGLRIWELDLRQHNITLLGNYNGTQTGDVIEDVPNAIVEGCLFPKESIPIIKSMYERMYGGEKQVTNQMRVWSDEKREYGWFEIIMTAVDEGTGKPKKAICTSREITEEKQMKEQYRYEIENRKSIAAEMLASCRVNVTDNMVEDLWHGEHNVMSAIVRPLTNYKERISLLLMNVQLSDEDNEELLPQNLSLKFTEGIRNMKKLYLAQRDNGYIWVQLQVKLMQSPTSSKIIAFFYSKDVTKQVMDQTINRVMTQKSYDMLGYICVPQKDLYVYHFAPKEVNPKPYYKDFDTITQYSIKKNVPEANQKKVLDALSLKNICEHLKTEEVYTVQYRFTTKNGEERIKQMQYTYADDSHTFIVAARKDNTEIFAEEERQRKLLHAALEDAKRANAAKSSFLSNMSHDIRTPMNAIMGLTALTMDEKNLPEQVIKNLTDIRSSSDFLLGLVNDILDMAKIEEGRMTIQKQPYHYSDFMSSMRTMFVPMCEQRGITFTMEPVKTTLTILTDPLRLNQVFFNILSNAVKYTPEGGSVTYNTENLKLEENQVSCDYIISDTGIGMSEEFQKNMFAPFAREDNSITPNLQGSGLGLSIAKKIVEAMGGTLKIESQEGKGTTVSIHLSFELAKEPEVKGGSTKEQENISYDILRNKHVLLVEDHPLNAEIARKLLEKKGIICTMVENGKLGVERFAASDEQFFDCILMDIRMPVMNGTQAARMIRGLNRRDAKIVPIIAMTANAYAEDVEESLAAGMNSHLSKPIKPELLYKTLVEKITDYK